VNYIISLSYISIKLALGEEPSFYKASPIDGQKTYCITPSFTIALLDNPILSGNIVFTLVAQVSNMTLYNILHKVIDRNLMTLALGFLKTKEVKVLLMVK